MRRRTFGAITFMFILCAAGAARAQQHPEWCQSKVLKDSAYHADMKELPPGRFGFSYDRDRAQLDDKSVPVFLNTVGAIQTPKPRAARLSCAEVWNRTARVVRAVQLRWDVRAHGEEGRLTEVLAKGLLPPVAIEVAAGVSRKVEIQGAQFADFFRPLAAGGEVNGSFLITIGVARVEFTDGTSIDLP
jgi:hypothetical protein